MRNLIRIASDLPVKGLLSALAAQPGLWDEITARQEYPGSAHIDTKAIFLRWCAGQDIPSAFTDLHAVDYPAFHALHRELWPIIDAVYSAVGGLELGRLMLVSLRPGGRVLPHIDEGPYADHFERFHVSLASEPGNVYSVYDEHGSAETVHMKPGELWWFNHKTLHDAENGSKAPRVHLIADIVAPKYRRERVQ